MQDQIYICLQDVPCRRMGVSPEALQVLSTPAIIQTTRYAAGVLQYPVATASKWCSMSLTPKAVMIRWRYLTALHVPVLRSPLSVVSTRVLFTCPLDRLCGLNSRRTVATQEEGSMPTTQRFNPQVCVYGTCYLSVSSVQPGKASAKLVNEWRTSLTCRCLLVLLH